jgi:hypothetical protein
MQRWNYQTRVIVACAIVLGALDICVRFATAPKAISSPVVYAQEFRLTDRDGNLRAVMDTNEDGEPGLKMYDKHNLLRLQLDTYQSTPSLIFLDENGTKRSYYGLGGPMNYGEESMLSLFDKDGSERQSLSESGTVLNADQVNVQWNVNTVNSR